MKKMFLEVLYKILVSLVILLPIIGVSACASMSDYSSFQLPVPATGYVTSIQMGSTLRGISQAISGAKGAFVMQNGNTFGFFWPFSTSNNLAFFFVDCNKLITLRNWFEVTGGQGNLVNPSDRADLLKMLNDYGWKVVPGSSVPQFLIEALANPNSWLARMSSSMTTFIFMTTMVPATQSDIEQIIREIQGAEAQKL